MKRLMILAAVLVLAATAYAGPYFQLEQNPIDIDASLLFGWGFFARVDNSNLSVTGDIHFENQNLWVYPTPWSIGGEIGLGWAVEGLDVLELSAATEVVLLPATWPAYVGLDTWATTLEVVGRPSQVVELYARAMFGFAVDGAIGIWNFTPRIGIRCEW